MDGVSGQNPAMGSDIPLQNSSNLRDLGGWPTMDGRHVRSGLVFRAPALIDLSSSDEATIAAFGLRTICDLRGAKERANAPVNIAGARHLSTPIEPSVGASLRDILRTGQVEGQVSPDEMFDLLRDAYRAYALQSHAQYRALFALLLGPGNLPLLLHCSAGKDRTGFGSALLLSALGVSWDNVLEDYLATNRFWRRETASMFDLPADIKDVLLGAHATLLDAAFEAAIGQYGSLDAYLERAIGLGPEARATLIALLVA